MGNLGHCITHCSSHFSAEHGELASKGLRYICISLYLQYLGLTMFFFVQFKETGLKQKGKHKGNHILFHSQIAHDVYYTLSLH